ncbi:MULTISPECIES: thiocillin family RiPP [Streptococcus]|uniref:thiocillin family RiPP n=1 Tax=Streptococcus TaxID=1301 RepID=UPI0008121129|nr:MULTISPECIES: thiocillin family RiPP [Streptococcus]MCO4483535.1 hypothetical protein [Streptococcus infantarius subsp. infantarius]MCR5051333.1 thiocillin family RiPP [Streptococcus sp.]SCA89926.1 hypothetical protein SMA679_1365 [Streptococcus macedonicus]
MLEVEKKIDNNKNDFHLEEDLSELEFGGFTTAGSFACVASWGACVSTGSSFSSAGD